ncbi:Nicotinamidase [Thermocrinis albus DSM 14484]|uniref:nicotinamidase n=1 Tax=Thermocrinis albus (strain DSM 14484 / JCM 11386 / HI 11/12) TaxID=638303 RepID=D3SML5_THEAH|nr:nicotinamidase [Thermocrinis albus]ADC89995.1 Nicotinamidase [Thermocrinis albus DSM 14484]
MKVKLCPHDALIVVDVQNDFMPWGALPVPEGDKVVEPLNQYIDIFHRKGLPVFFTRDWHPPDHISFKGHGGIWPPHCVQDTEGAMFHKDLFIPPDNKFIISKGTSRDFDAYSGFQGTFLDQLLRERGVKRIFVGGVATDYCVKNTVLGGLHLGYQVFLLHDAVRGLEGSTRAIEEMQEAGTVLVERGDLTI